MALLIQNQTLLEYLPDPEETVLTIPAHVRYIGDRAFRHPNRLEKIILPDTLRGIGTLAFAGCEALRSVNIPAGILHVPVNAFEKCPALWEIAVDGENPMYKSIGGILYTRDGRSLVCVPAGLDTAVNFTVPDGIREIGDYAFSGCRRIRTVILPDTVRFIGAGAFSGCDNLLWVDMSGSVTSIGKEAFRDTRWMQTDAEGFVTAGFVLVGYTGRNTEITVPDGIRVIGKQAFAGLPVTSVTLPESVVRIDDYAFCRCTELTHLHIPGGVRRIGYRAFYDTPWFGEQKEDFVICGDGVLIAYHGAREQVVIPEGVRCIGGGVFEQDASRYAEYPRRPRAEGPLVNPDDPMDLYGELCLREPMPDFPPSITSVYIPDGVTRIEARAFELCLSLQSVRLPEGMTYIGRSAFSGPMPEGVQIPESIRFMGQDCFDSGASLTFRRGSRAASLTLEHPWGGAWSSYDDETFLNLALLHHDPAVRASALAAMENPDYIAACRTLTEEDGA